MARRTGREGIYTRVVTKDLQETERKLSAKEMADMLDNERLEEELSRPIRQETREERLRRLGFEPVSEDQKAWNLLNFELYR